MFVKPLLSNRNLLFSRRKNHLKVHLVNFTWTLINIATASFSPWILTVLRVKIHFAKLNIMGSCTDQPKVNCNFLLVTVLTFIHWYTYRYLLHSRRIVRALLSIFACGYIKAKSSLWRLSRKIKCKYLPVNASHNTWKTSELTRPGSEVYCRWVYETRRTWNCCLVSKL